MVELLPVIVWLKPGPPGGGALGTSSHGMFGTTNWVCAKAAVETRTHDAAIAANIDALITVDLLSLLS